MLVTAKVLFVALALTGVAGVGIAAGALPLQNAIDIHEKHLGENSTMPDQSRHGQQNALDHLLLNQEKLINRNVTQVPDDDDLNETEVPEMD